MRYASVCDGVSAVSVAWSGLGCPGRDPMGQMPPGVEEDRDGLPQAGGAWEMAWRSEIDPFCNAVMEHRKPGFGTGPFNLGNMEAITDAELERCGPCDVLVGGTPCQSFSVAGLRKGLADPRGNLALVYLGLADRMRPRWVVWENVAGVLSVDQGRTFGAFLGGLEKLGYGVAYRVLDAQFCGVAQRRRRVFVVGCLGGWAAAAAVFLERSGLRGDPAPSRGAGTRVAGTLSPGAHPGGCNGQDAYAGQLIPVSALTASGVGTCGADVDQGQAGHLIAVDLYNQSLAEIAPTVRAGNAHDGVPHVMATGQGGAEVRADQSPTLTCDHEAPIVFDETQVTSPENRSRCDPESPSHSLASGARPPAVAFNHRQTPISGDVLGAMDTDETGPGAVLSGAVVRRLTPRECERLQGFPDDWTLVPNYRRKLAKQHRDDADAIARYYGMQVDELVADGVTPDGPRYKAMGNSMAVPVMRWIGRRIAAMEAVLA